MRTSKNANALREQGARQNTDCTLILVDLAEPNKPIKEFRLINDLSITVWRTAYEIEEARQYHADLGNLWRQAGCCIALSIFRLLGGGL